MNTPVATRSDPETADSAPTHTGTALVTGATGYIGGLLVPALLERGWQVRVLTRSAQRLEEEDWADRVEVAEGDASDPADLRRAADSVTVAYYLLHSMDGDGDFVERDRKLAKTFAQAAAEAGVKRLVYLGGLHPEGELSEHLASRVEVGEILLASGVPTAVLQAGVVLGDGSASFDMLRHLSERLPAVIAPRWVRNKIQPIAAADVVHYLAEAAELPREQHRTFDIGGPEVLTYAQMMRRYAEVAGLGGRFIATAPVLTPGLASLWVGLVTPVSAGIARPLVGSLVHDAVRHENDIESLVSPPPGGPTGFDDAVRAAIRDLEPRRWRRSVARSVATVGVAAVVGSILSDPDSRWYRSLTLPSWQPPAVAFPVVWTTLYALIALVSSVTTSEAEPARDGDRYQRALVVNMALNAAWSGVFFRAHRPVLATAVAGALTVSSADLVRRAAKTGRGRAIVLAAYPAWTAFATALSGTIARLNR